MGLCSVSLLLEPRRQHQRRHKPEAAGDELLRLARCWLARYEATGDLLMAEVP
jgi:hypothetical protein